MKLRRINKKNLLIILISALIIIYIMFVVFVLKENYLDMLNFKQKKELTVFFKIITRFGDWYTILAITVASFMLKNKNYFKYIFINVILLVILNQGLKIIFQRPRPELNILNASGYSFPSGHAMVNAGFYGFLIYIFFLSNFDKKIKIIISILLGILILLIGCSRVYLGAHYITDVIAGMCFSIIYLVIYIDLIKIGEKLL